MTTGMEETNPSSHLPFFPCPCLRLSHTPFCFPFSNLWLSAPTFYLYPATPPPSEIMPGQMPLLLLHYFVTILIRIPFLIFTVSLTGLASHSGSLGHGATCGCLCVCVNSLTRMKLWRRAYWFFSSTQHTFSLKGCCCWEVITFKGQGNIAYKSKMGWQDTHTHTHFPPYTAYLFTTKCVIYGCVIYSHLQYCLREHRLVGNFNCSVSCFVQ